MPSRLPTWMKVAVAIQLLLAGLFFLLGYSMTSSTRLGATPSLIDTLVLAMPVAAVAICGGAAWALWRAGRTALVPLLVFAPLPLAFVLFAVMGLF